MYCMLQYYLKWMVQKDAHLKCTLKAAKVHEEFSVDVHAHLDPFRSEIFDT